MGYHIVEQGECLSRIARVSGIANWRTIYDHPNNREFRQRRPDPNVIHPGDRIFIPDRELRTEACSTERRHRFRLSRAKTFLRLRILGDDGNPAAGRPYRLVLGESAYQGSTATDGCLKHEIDPGAESALLTVEIASGVRHTWSLRIGHLDPIEEVTGIQARLCNMGYFCAVDGIAGPETAEAVRRFQRRHQLAVDGVAGSRTRDKLREVYGC